MAAAILDALDVTVAGRREEATDILSFELVASDGAPLPAFSAGSHVDVEAGNGLLRQYSLCNDPAESHRYLIAVLKDPASRGGSRAMHDLVQVGSRLRISRPKNHFALARDARRSILVAGGIGVTPLLAMAERLSVTGADFEFHYCARTPSRTAFRDRLAASPFASAVRFHFDDGADDQKLDMSALLKSQPRGTHLYVCGPQGFMDAVLSRARDAAWPEPELHYEFFGAKAADDTASSSFEVQLASSGRVVLVRSDQSVVQALAQAGADIPTSCEQGVCGTCVTRVLQGTPEHRDFYFTPAEHERNDQFTPCCSRSRSPRLVLDL